MTPIARDVVYQVWLHTADGWSPDATDYATPDDALAQVRALHRNDPPIAGAYNVVRITTTVEQPDARDLPAPLAHSANDTP